MERFFFFFGGGGGGGECHKVVERDHSYSLAPEFGVGFADLGLHSRSQGLENAKST